MRLRWSVVIGGSVGLLLWFLTQLMAFGLAQAGDGWLAPFYLTLPLFILYPLASIPCFASFRRTAKVEWLALFVAVALDLFLLQNVLRQERDYFLRVWRLGPAVVAIWLALWLGWQLLAIVALVRRHVSEPAHQREAASIT